jgi:hypothetical protein
MGGAEIRLRAPWRRRLPRGALANHRAALHCPGFSRLHQLDDLIAAPLRFDRGDSLNRSTGSPESIELVHGDDAAERFEEMRRRVQCFEQENDVRVLSAAAAATAVDEPLPAVFLRADAALSLAKDTEAERRAASEA